ncbi:MAG: hypothetical protein WA131_02230 [Desulfitobacteriaceae bacterium]
METFFQSDSRIKSLLEQIIEKIFTVCLLKGTEAELAVEFAKGRQLVVKVTMLLTEISSLPPTALVDAIHQLLEQRLPDQRIINNFPKFYQVMEDMIREGIVIVSENHKQHLLQKPTSVIVLAGGREPMLTSRSSGSYMTIPSNQENLTFTVQDLSENTSEYLDSPVLAAATDLDTEKKHQVTQTCDAFNLTEINETEDLKPSNIKLQQNLSKDLSLSKNRVKSSSQVPLEATRLALVLQQIFPNTQARWNFNLGKNNFLVQIQDLLIYLEIFSEGDRVEKEMKKEGWKVIVCNNEDLCFPRRLERAIHRVLKDPKYKL